jgi:hypothetical protein
MEEIMEATDQEYRKRASAALNFLDNHPALVQGSGTSFLNESAVWMYPVCKRGRPENDPITLSPSHERYGKLFNPAEDEDGDDVYASYEEVYDEPWSFDHVTYGVSASFYTFHGEVEKDQYDPKHWDRYEGFYTMGKSFEEAFINAAIQTVRAYGPFEKFKSFHTDAERKNNEEEDFLFAIPRPGGEEELHPNKAYIHVSTATENLRWLAWFITTEYYEQNYKDAFGEVFSNRARPYLNDGTNIIEADVSGFMEAE